MLSIPVVGFILLRFSLPLPPWKSAVSLSPAWTVCPHRFTPSKSNFAHPVIPSGTRGWAGRPNSRDGWSWRQRFIMYGCQLCDEPAIKATYHESALVRRRNECHEISFKNNRSYTSIKWESMWERSPISRTDSRDKEQEQTTFYS